MSNGDLYHIEWVSPKSGDVGGIWLAVYTPDKGKMERYHLRDGTLQFAQGIAAVLNCDCVIVESYPPEIGIEDPHSEPGPNDD